MKLSVSVPDEAVAYLDELARTGRFSSRSAAIHGAIRLLRAHDLGEEYASASREWEESGEEDAWDATLEDGMTVDRP